MTPLLDTPNALARALHPSLASIRLRRLGLRALLSPRCNRHIMWAGMLLFLMASPPPLHLISSPPATLAQICAAAACALAAIAGMATSILFAGWAEKPHHVKSAIHARLNDSEARVLARLEAAALRRVASRASPPRRARSHRL